MRKRMRRVLRLLVSMLNVYFADRRIMFSCDAGMEHRNRNEAFPSNFISVIQMFLLQMRYL